MISDQEIAAGVQQAVAEVLSIEVEEISPSSRFFADLGGESIDLLDLAFRCEKKFGTKLQFDKMLSADEAKTNEQGQLTPESLAAIQLKFPALDVSRFQGASRAVLLQELLTVGAIADFIKQHLAKPPASAA